MKMNNSTNLLDVTQGADLVCIVSKKAKKKPLPMVTSSLLASASPSRDEMTVSLLEEKKLFKTSSHSGSYPYDHIRFSSDCVESYDIKHGKASIDPTTGCCFFPKKQKIESKNKKPELEEYSSSTMWKFLSKESLLKTPHQDSFSDVSSVSCLTCTDRLPTVFFEANKKVWLFQTPVNTGYVQNKFPMCATSGLNCIPLVDCKLTSSKLCKMQLQNIKVISQIDDKFIVCKTCAPSNDMGSILLFDQHAVHERIRLEQLVKESVEENNDFYRVKPIPLHKPILLRVSLDQLEAMQKFEKVFNYCGLRYDICLLGNAGNVYINDVPVCLNGLPNLVQKLHELIEERTATLKAHGSVGISLSPTIFNHLCSKACHGAIKFGDHLNAKQCNDLLLALRHCDLPFQCAHGRPSVFPLVSLDEVSVENDPESCNFNVLKTLRM